MDVYDITATFPKEEKFGLVSRRRRCAIGLPSNIAESAARNTHKEFINFLHIAQAPLAELDTQLEISLRLEYINEETWNMSEVKHLEEDKILSGLITSLKRRNNRPNS